MEVEGKHLKVLKKWNDSSGMIELSFNWNDT